MGVSHVTYGRERVFGSSTQKQRGTRGSSAGPADPGKRVGQRSASGCQPVGIAGVGNDRRQLFARARVVGREPQRLGRHLRCARRSRRSAAQHARQLDADRRVRRLAVGDRLEQIARLVLLVRARRGIRQAGQRRRRSAQFSVIARRKASYARPYASALSCIAPRDVQSASVAASSAARTAAGSSPPSARMAAAFSLAVRP